MEPGTASVPEITQRRTLLWRAPLPRSYINFVGRKILRLILTIQGLGAFALITLAVMITKFGASRRVILPLIRAELAKSGVRLFAMTMLVSVALGLIIIGQTVSLLQRVNANQFLGMVMASVVVRELGPLLTALIVLSRTGTANVIELGTARALGEVEALEALGIDPIHYLVVPRVVGMALGIFSLTIYLVIGALLSGYLWAFFQDVPLTPGEYFSQLTRSLDVTDFVVLASKSALFGVIIAVVTCYHGLAQPLRLEEVSGATVRAVAQSVIFCMALDAFFIVIYLVV
ncbi:MAG TPA: ABC transporter permease [Candidatus Acidoferrum sp.]|nr:ABC transporter permease [Candidatus Acidoferrum sp.]